MGILYDYQASRVLGTD
ncbi:hypothetical protein A2U01_0115323, partial [Trifolium medium]|nr:hypothetical protein [Trifolium medium]